MAELDGICHPEGKPGCKRCQLRHSWLTFAWCTQPEVFKALQGALAPLGIRLSDLGSENWSLSDGRSLTRFHDGVVRFLKDATYLLVLSMYIISTTRKCRACSCGPLPCICLARSGNHMPVLQGPCRKIGTPVPICLASGKGYAVTLKVSASVWLLNIVFLANVWLVIVAFDLCCVLEIVG